jgi:hypothetical protein
MKQNVKSMILCVCLCMIQRYKNIDISCPPQIWREIICSFTALYLTTRIFTSQDVWVIIVPVGTADSCQPLADKLIRHPCIISFVILSFWQYYLWTIFRKTVNYVMLFIFLSLNCSLPPYQLTNNFQLVSLSDFEIFDFFSLCDTKQLYSPLSPSVVMFKTRVARQGLLL